METNAAAARSSRRSMRIGDYVANVDSHHHVETVFEHFTCRSYVREGWGPHSFTKDTAFHCRCGGEPSEYWDKTFSILRQYETPVSGTDNNDGQT